MLKSMLGSTSQTLAGTLLCLVALLGSLEALELAGPGGQPIWELSVTTQVRCSEGAPVLPASIILNATLPQASGTLVSRNKTRKARFLISQGLTWGRDGSLFVEGPLGLPRRLGQIELEKIQCMQPLEAEAAGMTTQARFEITLPLWMEPSTQVTLVRKREFPCIRKGRGVSPSGPGLINSAFASETSVRTEVWEHESYWTRNNQDLLMIRANHDYADRSPIQIQGANLSHYQTWAACRLAESEKSTEGSLPK